MLQRILVDHDAETRAPGASCSMSPSEPTFGDRDRLAEEPLGGEAVGEPFVGELERGESIHYRGRAARPTIPTGPSRALAT